MHNRGLINAERWGKKILTVFCRLIETFELLIFVLCL